uniref:Alpha beta-hydrolase n=1 Tax=Tetraselmis sp. GSL018 TaxID=582737 RepID=A0A061RNW9_9CHLO
MHSIRMFYLLVICCGVATVCSHSRRTLSSRNFEPHSQPLKPFGSAPSWELDPPIAHGGDRGELSFDFARSLKLANLAAVSQCQPHRIANWTCTRCWHIPDFQDASVNHDLERELLAFTGWLPSLNSAIVVFRGTDRGSLSNWLADLRGWQTDFDLPWPRAEGCRVHSGFFGAYNASTLRPFVSHNVERLLEAHEGAPVTVVGHSLGGALASLCAAELAAGHLVPGRSPEVHLMTLGSPRVGNEAFAEFVDRAVSSSLRVTHMNDVVPSLPIRAMGFHHLRREVWLADIRFETQRFFSSPVQVPVVCDGSGEDPLCHAGQCTLGLCTSVYNHVHGYFGLFMGQSESC